MNNDLVPDETLLGLLAAQPQHGYQLLTHFHAGDQLGNVWRMSTSQLYAVLKRLERCGWIMGVQVESDNAPPRTEYRITDAGIVQLESWLTAEPSASIRRVRVEFLSRLYVARLLDLPTAQIVRRQKAACAAELAQQRDLHRQTEPGVGLLAVEFVIAQLETVLHWIDRCELVPDLPLE